MAEPKTKATKDSVLAFLKKVEPKEKRDDAMALLKMFEKVTGEKGVMWGSAIVGFGTYHYKYDTGREGEICLVGFSPRKPSLVLYVGFALEYKELMARLGKYKTGKSCLYIKKLDDIDRGVLKEIIVKSVAEMRKRYVCD